MSKNTLGAVRIGTSGIVVPGTKISFPEAFKSGSRLHYYGSLFNTLEVNSSFYKIPLPKTFEKWVTEVPTDFTFTIKLWQGITHAKNLDYNAEDIDLFIHAVNQVGDKKGCLLVQFPAGIHDSHINKLEEMLERLHQHSSWTIAVEFRHLSWYRDATYKLLDKYCATIVFHDMPNSKTPLDYVDPKTLYCRFQGPTGKYNGGYPDDFIREFADQCLRWRNMGKEIYVYFNNTIGEALQNAQFLQKLINN